MPPPFCDISATRGYMGEIMLYIRGFRLFPGKSAACFRSCAARSGSPAVPPQAALPSLLIYKEAPCAPEGFCPLTNCPSAHPERSPDPPTGRGSVIFAGNAPFCNAAAPAGLPTVFTLRTDPASYASTKRNLYFHIVSVFLWMHKKRKLLFIFPSQTTEFAQFTPYFCMEAHSSHSYSL